MQVLNALLMAKVVFVVGIPKQKAFLSQSTADDLYKPTLPTLNQ